MADNPPDTGEHVMICPHFLLKRKSGKISRGKKEDPFCQTSTHLQQCSTQGTHPQQVYMLAVRSHVSQPSAPLIGEHAIAMLPRGLSLSNYLTEPAG